MSADQGSDFGYCGLGYVYNLLGKEELAEKNYLIGAELGDHVSQNNLGVLYSKQGRYRLAYKYFKMSAKQGYTPAKENLEGFKKKLLNLSFKEKILFYK